jgi:DNA replication protein DnaC
LTTAKALEQMDHWLNPLASNGAPLREPMGERVVNCEQHGDYTSAGTRYLGKREVWTSCPDCAEARLAAERQAEADAEAKRRQDTIISMMDEANIPARFIGRTFDNYRATTEGQRQALATVREYAETFPKHFKAGTGLVLSGLPGTGKSHLAGAVLQHILPAHVGLYVTCMAMIRAVRGTWRKDSEKSEREMLAMFTDVSLLVLDEIGVQYGTDGEQTIIFDVLDRRYREMKPTILLTNQAKKGFKEFIGERSFDRVVETSRWVPFDWESYRATARKEAL